MLELAIAEAYRPRPRPPSTAPPRPVTFATNPNIRAYISSSRSRTPSVPPRTPSATSHLLSLRAFIPRRKRPDSVLSDRTIVPSDAARTDSVLSASTVRPATQVVERPRTPSRPLPALPSPVPLPPQEELSYFDTALHDAIEEVQTQATSVSRDLGIVTLEHLAHVADIASCVATSWPEFWGMLIHAAKLISSVLPTADVAVRNVLVRSLARIAERWNRERRRSTVEIAGIAGEVFDEVIRIRKTVDEKLGGVFARLAGGCCHGFQKQDDKELRILTLGISTAVLAALTYVLASNADLEIHLSVLSSFDQGLPPPPSYSRLHITIYPTSAVSTASQSVDILLLEPNCINSCGDLRCQNGALGTAVCVQTLSPSARVVALSSVDNMTSATMKRRTPSVDDGGLEALETVPARFMNMYVTDVGVLKAGDLEGLIVEAEVLDLQILGEEGD